MSVDAEEARSRQAAEDAAAGGRYAREPRGTGAPADDADPPVFLAIRQEEEPPSGSDSSPLRPGLLAVVAVVLVATFLVGRETGPRPADRTAPASAARTEATAPTQEGGAGEADEAPSSPAVDRGTGGEDGRERQAGDGRGGAAVLAVLADSLSSSLKGYGERRALYRDGRLSCRGLARAFEVVDERFMKLALAYRRGRSEPAPGADSLFEVMAARTDSVDRHFDSSGCSRP
ncbi:MAG TPA: hypothetical protein VKA44_06600 [Gemmatimonadota bacterium]|nr:hypothetical protein [Gemmatimonadota bacterium]